MKNKRKQFSLVNPTVYPIGHIPWAHLESKVQKNIRDLATRWQCNGKMSVWDTFWIKTAIKGWRKWRRISTVSCPRGVFQHWQTGDNLQFPWRYTKLNPVRHWQNCHLSSCTCPIRSRPWLLQSLSSGWHRWQSGCQSVSARVFRSLNCQAFENKIGLRWGQVV